MNVMFFMFVSVAVNVNWMVLFSSSLMIICSGDGSSRSSTGFLLSIIICMLLIALFPAVSFDCMVIVHVPSWSTHPACDGVILSEYVLLDGEFLRMTMLGEDDAMMTLSMFVVLSVTVIFILNGVLEVIG